MALVVRSPAPSSILDATARAVVGVCTSDGPTRAAWAGVLHGGQHRAVFATSATEAMAMFGPAVPVALLVLDADLPDAAVGDLCMALKSVGQHAPVLVHGRDDHPRARLDAYAAGAADYVSHDSSVPELEARVAALIRRGRLPRQQVLPSSRLSLDEGRHSIRWGTCEVGLTPTEMRLCRPLVVAEPGAVVRRHVLRVEAWPRAEDISTNTLDTFIRKLRLKFARLDSPWLIETVLGTGYRLVDATA